MGLQQRFLHQVVILGVAILDQRPLHSLFVGISGNIYPFHGAGIQAGVVHHGGQRRGGGIEILHLLRIVTHFPDVFCQLDGFLQGGAGMAGHQVGNEVLVHTVLLVESKILVHKPVVNCISGLAHFVQHHIGYVLRRHLQLAGNVILHQFFKEGILFVRQQIVKPDTATDKYFFDTGDLP